MTGNNIMIDVSTRCDAYDIVEKYASYSVIMKAESKTFVTVENAFTNACNVVTSAIHSHVGESMARKQWERT